MEKNNKMYITIITRIIGLGIGYSIGSGVSSKVSDNQRMNVSHMALNDLVMSNGGSVRMSET